MYFQEALGPQMSTPDRGYKEQGKAPHIAEAQQLLNAE